MKGNISLNTKSELLEKKFTEHQCHNPTIITIRDTLANTATTMK